MRCTPTGTPGCTFGLFCPFLHPLPCASHFLTFIFVWCFVCRALTFYKGDRWSRQKNVWNICSVMCATINMLTLSFQAAASKPRLAALIGFNRVCGFIWQRYLRQSVFHTTLRNAQLSVETSAGYGEYSLFLSVLRLWLIVPCVSAGSGYLKNCRMSKKTTQTPLKLIRPRFTIQHRCWIV